MIGSPFSIKCTAAGSPQPAILWRKDGLVLKPEVVSELQIVETDNGRTSTIEVSEGRSEFNGVYECVAVNVAGSATKSTPHIELQGWL